MKKLIVVADYASDSLPCQELQSAVEGFSQIPDDVKISFVSSTPSTIHTSFLLAQVIETEERYGRPQNTVIFVNTDPRIQTTQSVEKAQGSPLVIIRLVSGIYLCGPNAGYCFSLIKHKIDELYTYNGLEKGSQFRSRDLYARVSAHLMDNLQDEMELEEIHTNFIPELSDFYIGHIDNYGNIKTTIIAEDFKGTYAYGDTVKITINGITKNARFVSNLFGAEPGVLVIYPGSSGKRDNPYLEISVWRHFTEQETTTGKHAFGDPKPGSKINI